jgi:hypothetical protein
MPLAGFDPAMPAIERLQTYALARKATGIGNLLYYIPRKYFLNKRCLVLKGIPVRILS